MSSGFGPKSDDLGHQIFKSKNGMLSKFKMLSTTANSSRTIDELDGDSCIPGSGVASRPETRSARLSVAKLQSAGAGSGRETKSSALSAHLSVDAYS